MLPYNNVTLESMEGEIWKPCTISPNYYHISNLGRVKSLERTFYAGKKYAQKVTYHECILSQYKNKKGYLIVGICMEDGKAKSCKVHILVAQAFLPNPLNKPTVDHVEAIKDDNRLENIKWATWKEQGETTKRLGLVKRVYGKDHHQSKAVYQYTLKGELVATHGSCGEAERTTGFSAAHINKNCRGQYDFFGDYVFSYDEKPKEYFNREFLKRNLKEKIVIKLDGSGNEIARYFNCTIAGRENSLHHSNIHCAAIGKIKTCGGFKWKYANENK